MHEFVFSSRSRRRETAQQIHHSPSKRRADPDIAVYNPHYIAFRFSICSAHVPNLGIGSQILNPAISTGEVRILFFHQYLRVEPVVVRYETLES